MGGEIEAKKGRPDSDSELRAEPAGRGKPWSGLRAAFADQRACFTFSKNPDAKARGIQG